MVWSSVLSKKALCPSFSRLAPVRPQRVKNAANVKEEKGTKEEKGDIALFEKGPRSDGWVVCCRKSAMSPFSFPFFDASHAGPPARCRLGSALRQRGIDHDIRRDFGRTLVGVTFAIDTRVPFEGAADIELRVDDRPVVVELDSLELGKTAAPPEGVGVLDVFEVEPNLGRQ